MPASLKGPAFETAGADGGELSDIREEAETCTRCDLYRDATHLVFGEVKACAWWLAAELRLLRPRLVVALYSLLGRQAKVTRDRGAMMATPDGLPVLVTIHPSALLRTIDQPDAEMNGARFIDDLKKIGPFLE